MRANFLHSFIAVVAGNALYFLLAPYLPPQAQHAAARFGPGTLLDFCICLMIFFLIKRVARRRQRSKPLED
jgi:hypothetical protein